MGGTIKKENILVYDRNQAHMLASSRKASFSLMSSSSSSVTNLTIQLFLALIFVNFFYFCYFVACYFFYFLFSLVFLLFSILFMDILQHAYRYTVLIFIQHRRYISYLISFNRFVIERNYWWQHEVINWNYIFCYHPSSTLKRWNVFEVDLIYFVIQPL